MKKEVIGILIEISLVILLVSILTMAAAKDIEMASTKDSTLASSTNTDTSISVDSSSKIPSFLNLVSYFRRFTAKIHKLLEKRSKSNVEDASNSCKPNRTTVFLLLFISIFLVLVPLIIGITSICISQLYPNECDNRDRMGLNISDYLLGGGLASVILAFLNTIFLLMFFYSKIVSIACIILLLILNYLFDLAWFVVGAFILLRSNIFCIQQSSTPVVYALVLWCLVAASLISQYKGYRRIRIDDI